MIVEFWDITEILFPGMSSTLLNDKSDIFTGPILKFFNLNEVLKKLNQINIHYCISLISFNLKTFRIFKRISKLSIPIAIIIPHHFSSDLAFVKKYKRIKYFSIKEILLRIKHLILKIKLFFIKIPFDLVITWGKEFPILDPRINSNTTVLNLHSWDYDLSIIERNKNYNNETEYAVFIDNYFPFHTDPKRLGIKPHEDANKYYPELRAFFEKIEQKFNLEIIISAHPKSNYKNNEDYFDSRKIIKGKSNLLIKGAKFVILHYSTAISFAVIYRKPLLFITTDRLIKTKFSLEIPSLAKLFDQSPINISKNNTLDMEFIKNIDNDRYIDFSKNYIKSNFNIKRTSWFYVINHIKKINYNKEYYNLDSSSKCNSV